MDPHRDPIGLLIEKSQRTRVPLDEDGKRLSALQSEIGAWCADRFGHGPDCHVVEEDVVAIAEEAGEVCRAFTKRHHLSRGRTYEEWTQNLRDEIGDVAVTVLASAYNVDIDLAYFRAQMIGGSGGGSSGPAVPGFAQAVRLTALVGEMSDVVEKRPLLADVALVLVMCRLWICLEEICATEQWDLIEVLADRWGSVSERPTEWWTATMEMPPLDPGVTKLHATIAGAYDAVSRASKVDRPAVALEWVQAFGPFVISDPDVQAIGAGSR